MRKHYEIMRMWRRGARVQMTVTLWQLKEQMATLAAEMKAEGTALTEMCAQPNANIEDIRKKKQHAAEMKERYDILKDQHDQIEARERAAMAAKGGAGGEAQMTFREAAGRFYKAALGATNMHELGQMVYQQLGAIPASSTDQGNGSNLLPTNLSNELLTAPLVENPLAALMTRTQIAGLEIPAFDFDLDDDDFISDGATAKELKLNADGKISFGRNLLKLIAKISDTVLRGSPLALENAVSNALHSKLALKELKALFATAPAAADEHMSFYANGITEVTGVTMLEAILNAFGDLEDFYRPNAVCVMRSQDYFKMIREMNGAENLYGKKPQEVLGFNVVFCERAVTPVVGDMRFLHENFDIAGMYETDKDIVAGVNRFVLTNWFDIRIKMKAAFRLAKADVVVLPPTTNPRLSSLTIGALTLEPAFDPDVRDYKATTENATDAITAVAVDTTGSTVAIKNGTTAVTSGEAATWTAGANVVTVTVTNGGVKRVYKVKVTKE